MEELILGGIVAIISGAVGNVLSDQLNLAFLKKWQGPCCGLY
ncbi:MAG: hypothetical protein QNK37_38250 [Acidobacteriota bacterium]|nr:hypothetical protein [Acidobacteriota bacterium]